MTTEELREPRQAAEAVDAKDRRGRGHGRRSDDGPTTTVPVIPLWDRPRTEVRG
ncbi:hypothetical protein [Streptomyces capitiformicae]|uniref:hypothetical protein n=1 Tax=Streptomyces capitiformicae TaxID=2014920 RepID=UPI0016779835|nr:hypothetical protein [Streptomyces capitiformicae]